MTNEEVEIYKCRIKNELKVELNELRQKGGEE